MHADWLEAGIDPNHKKLLDLYEQVTKAKSGDEEALALANQAVTAAQQLAESSCTTGYSVRRVHGVLIGLRLLMKIGNTHPALECVQ